MECKDCKYNKLITLNLNSKEYINRINTECEITHRMNPKSCTYIADDTDVKNMNICFNCKYWIGGGDWGLSCQKNYYNCSTNGFGSACRDFERKGEKTNMKKIFDRIIAKLEDISEHDDYGKIVDLDEAIDTIYEVSHEYDGKYLNKKEHEELLEYKAMYEGLCR